MSKYLISLGLAIFVLCIILEFPMYAMLISAALVVGGFVLSMFGK